MPGVLGAPQVIQCDWCAGFLRKNFGDQVKGANAMVRSLDSLRYRHRVKDVVRQM